jgi:signal peptidase II
VSEQAQSTAAAAAMPKAVAPGFAGKAWFWAPVLPLVALDLWSKHAVFSFLARTYPGEIHSDHPIWRGAVNFSLVNWTNKGTIWGLGQGMTVPLIVLRCVALVALVWWARTTPSRERLRLLVIGLILAGAIGNLYDNLTRHDRAVRDFLRFTGTWPWTWDFPAFNVADSCITVGAIGLLVTLFRKEPGTAPKGRAVS